MSKSITQYKTDTQGLFTGPPLNACVKTGSVMPFIKRKRNLVAKILWAMFCMVNFNPCFASVHWYCVHFLLVIDFWMVAHDSRQPLILIIKTGMATVFHCAFSPTKTLTDSLSLCVAEAPSSVHLHPAPNSRNIRIINILKLGGLPGGLVG